MSLPNGSKSSGKAWPKRRHFLDRIAVDPRLTRGAKSLLLLLASRSDDSGKPVWGGQNKLAEQSDTSIRSVRRYCVEAEALGYVKVYRSRPQRGPDGRWCRRRSNSYYLALPPAASPLEAPRRVKPAGRCVVASHHRRSYLPDSAGPSTPYGVSQPGSSAPVEAFSTVANRPEPEPMLDHGAASARFAAIRAQLGPSRRR